MDLNTFLKMKGLAPTGGQARLLIRSGRVKVNDEVETRNKRKLRFGDVIIVDDKRYLVE